MVQTARGRATVRSNGPAFGNHVANNHRRPPGGGGGGGLPGDTYTHTTLERAPGMGQRLSNSFCGFMFGPILILVACFLLWHNEGSAIRTHKSLDQALDHHYAVDSSKPVTGEYDNELVHLTGKLGTQSPATDTLFGLQRDNTISVTRNVEIYQWVEHSKTTKRKQHNGDTIKETTYHYSQEWKRKPVDSSKFMHPSGHENYGILPFSSQTFTAGGIHLAGKYMLDESLLKQITWKSPVPMEAITHVPGGARIEGSYIYLAENGARNDIPKLNSHGDDLSGEIERNIVTMDGEDKIVYTLLASGEQFSSKERALQAAASAPRAQVSQQQNSNNHLNRQSGPRVGDVRISFSETKCDVVSVLGRLYGTMISKWPSKHPGYEVGILKRGYESAPSMIQSAQASNSIKTWVVRGAGWLFNFIGFTMVTSIISTSADITLNWIPLLGPMATSLINIGVTLANLILASSTTTLVAGAAWIFYRPVLGISLVAGSIGLFYTASRAGAGGEREIKKAA